MRFTEPSNFWFLLLVPLFGMFFFWALLRKRRDMGRFASVALLGKLSQNLSRERQYAKYLLFLFGTMLAVVALTGPQFGTRLAMAERKGVDVLVLLDVSRSMLAEDVKPSRLIHAKFQIGQLLDQMEGDRIGLVIFAGQAFVQCPLTLDRGAMQMFLDIVGPQTVPVQGTALAEAIELGIKSFAIEDRQHKVMVIFTDGEEHQGDPIIAGTRAADAGVRIFTVGMGTAEGELIPQRRDRSTLAYHKDRQGQYVKTRLDELTLRKIAVSTDGEYFRSTLSGAEIQVIHDEIGGMEQKDLGNTRFTQFEERFQIPLLLAVIFFFSNAWMSDRKQERSEWRGRFA